MKTIKVSGPVIIKDNKVLLIKDIKDAFWKYPGGKVESGESLEQTCIREAKEELAIDVFNLKHLTTITSQKDETTKVELVHYLTDYSGEIVKGLDIIEWDWFDINNLPDN